MTLSSDETKIIKSSETSTTIIKLRSDGIVHVHMKDKAVFDVPQQQEHIYACIDLVGEKKHPFLYTIGEYVNVTKEARENTKNLEPISPMYAIAIVVDNLAYKLFADFYQKIYKPTHPTKNFSNKEKAIEWLINFPKPS